MLLRSGRAPATAANAARNARAPRDRLARWAPARDALWAQLDRLTRPGARVAVAGAGNADDLPLARLAARAGEVALVDCDGAAAARARRRIERPLRRRVHVVEHDVTLGVADAIVRAVADGRTPAPAGPAGTPLPGAPYDLVVGDLFYSQLLYPALADLGLSAPASDAVTGRLAPGLTRAVVARLHASAPGGAVVHVHDPIGWWPGRPQPVTLGDVLRAAARSPRAALDLAARGLGPSDSDPRAALRALGLPLLATAVWRWPFADGVDYLACATTSAASGPSAPRGTTQPPGPATRR